MAADAEAADAEAIPPPPQPPDGDAGRPERAARRGSALEENIERVVAWLRQCSLTKVQTGGRLAKEVSDAVGEVISASKRSTFQQTKAFKHRTQVEAIAAQCIRCVPESSDTVVELGAGQAVLGHAVSLASGLPLVAVDRRGNTDAFDADTAEEPGAPTSGLSAPAVTRVQADIADEGAWPEEGRLVLLAKHLCGHSSDIAIDATLRLGPRLSLLCLAPCCHATMTWAKLSPESQRWLEEAGFPCGPKEFALLVDMIRLSRVGAAQDGKGAPCSKWKLRQYLDEAEIEPLGRRACRALDEARLARLRAGGLEVALVQYCGAEVTPDNVLILASPEPLRLDGSAPAAPLAPGQDRDPGVQQVGVLLETDPTGSETLTQRLVAYLYERRAQHFPALRSVVPVDDHLASRLPGILCLADTAAEVHPLLEQLAKCPLLKRAVTRPLPFERRADSCEALAEQVVALLREASGDQEKAASVRVLGRPRQLETLVCTALGPEWLSPARFTHMLCIAPDGAGAGAGAGGAQGEGAAVAAGPLRFSLLPRAVLDLPGWATARQADEGARAFWRCTEVAMRWPQRLEAAGAVALWTDSQEPAAWLEGWADQFLPAGSPVAELRTGPRSEGAAGALKCSPVRGSWGAGDARAGVLLCSVGEGGNDAVDALAALLAAGTAGDAPHLAAAGLVVVRLRCGRKARSVKRWHREMSQQLEARLGARRIELLHLLCDREPERTAVFSWDAAASASLWAQPEGPGAARDDAAAADA